LWSLLAAAAVLVLAGLVHGSAVADWSWAPPGRTWLVRIGSALAVAVVLLTAWAAWRGVAVALELQNFVVGAAK